MEFQAESATLPLRDRAFGPLLRLSFSANALLLGLAFGYLGLFQVLSLTVPGMSSKGSGEVVIGIMFFSVPAVLFGLLSYKFAEMAIFEKPDRPIPTLLRNFKAVLVDRERIAAGIPVAVALITFMYVFTMVKSYITVFVPFTWDRTFDAWDVALHFGYRPWELLQPLFGYWPVTFFINLNYNMWFVVMNVFWAYYAFIAKPGLERTRFFLSYMLCWIIGGGVLAVLFSSAGPCYFTRLGYLPDPYSPLMAYLNGANGYLPIWALNTQDMLWDLHAEGSAFGGVSAMPSMHNATALLFILTSAGRPAWVRRGLIVHAALIFLGSIHLGWHYAIDGYAAWIVALAVWRVSGPLAQWWEGRRPVADYHAALKAGL